MCLPGLRSSALESIGSFDTLLGRQISVEYQNSTLIDSFIRSKGRSGHRNAEHVDVPNHNCGSSSW